MAGRDGRDRVRPWDLGTGFDGGTGRYGQILTAGRDRMGRFGRQDGRVEAGFVDGTGLQGQVLSMGRDSKGICPRRDGTGRVNGT